MRLPLFLLLTSGIWAGPLLPEVAGKLPMSGCRIKLEWTAQPAGSIAPPRTVAGTLELADGDRFRFKSSELVIVSDGSVIRQWNGSTNQVLIRAASKVQASELPSSLLRAALAGSELASSSEKLEGKPALKLSLDVSRPPLSRYAHASLWAKESDHTPLRLEVEDAEGGTIAWKLLSIQTWKPSSKDFELTSPKGAEVVDLR